MLSHIRRSAWVLLALLSTAPGSVVATSGDSGATCEGLRTWASSYTNVAPTLDELARFDRARRVAIFNAVSPEVRAALWREQFARLAQRSNLSGSQRTLVSEARSLAVPALYRKDPAAQEAVRAFWARAKTAFVTKEHQRAFFDLGVVIPGAAPFRTARLSDDEYCECSKVEAWPQCMGAFCVSATCISFLGCGPFGGHICNGICDW